MEDIEGTQESTLVDSSQSTVHEQEKPSKIPRFNSKFGKMNSSNSSQVKAPPFADERIKSTPVLKLFSILLILVL